VVETNPVLGVGAVVGLELEHAAVAVGDRRAVVEAISTRSSWLEGVGRLIVTGPSTGRAPAVQARRSSSRLTRNWQAWPQRARHRQFLTAGLQLFGLVGTRSAGQGSVDSG